MTTKKRKAIQFEDIQSATFWNDEGELTMFFKGHEVIEPPEPVIPEIVTGITLTEMVCLPAPPTNIKAKLI